MEPQKIRIVIADDHAIVRKGLVQIIVEIPDMEVVGEAENGRQAIEKVRALQPDVVVLDINMPEKSGWDVLVQVKDEFPEIPVIILSIAPEKDYAVQFFKAKASGYLNKQSAPKELIDAIRKVNSGRKYISQSMAETLTMSLGEESDNPPHESLSPREFQILCMIGSGKTVTGIAEELSLSSATISSHRAKILQKMGMKNNAQLTHYVFQNKINV
jgi:two-component system, NarL family, invasion response regulator UvrY